VRDDPPLAGAGGAHERALHEVRRRRRAARPLPLHLELALELPRALRDVHVRVLRRPRLRLCLLLLLPRLEHRLREAVAALERHAAVVALLELHLHAGDPGGTLAGVGVARAAADAVLLLAR